MLNVSGPCFVVVMLKNSCDGEEKEKNFICMGHFIDKELNMPHSKERKHEKQRERQDQEDN